MAFIGGAQLFNANDAQFVNINLNRQSSNPTQLLNSERAIGATHKSQTADRAPKCNPKTRKKIIADIMKWVEATPKPILLLHGPAGAGKTCIMREVVARYKKVKNVSEVSYFFSAQVDELNNERPFIATIAHQLAQSKIPGLESAIIQAVSNHPGIFREGLESQMEALIVEPLQKSGITSPSSARRVLIVIDGLDECSEKSERESLLRLLLSLVNMLSRSLIVAIASRFEPDIRTVFDFPQFQDRTQIIRLQDYDGTEDIGMFYSDEFGKIRQTHPLKRYISPSWPTQEILGTLINKSPQNFTYPSVIMKYIVSNSGRNPVEMLDDAMSLHPSSGALAELDALYALILHPSSVDFPRMRRLLHLILAVEVKTRVPDPLNASVTAGLELHKNPSFFDELLQLPPSTTEGTLVNLHSVIHIPTPTSLSYDLDIRFYDRCLVEFLLSPDRSGDLFQSRYETHVDLTRACIKLSQSWVEEPTVDYQPALSYAFHFSIGHFQDLFKSDESTPLPDDILGYDPRCLSLFLFVYSGRTIPGHAIRSLRSALHESHCTSGCSPLCNGLLVMDQCETNMGNFASVYWSTRGTSNILNDSGEKAWRGERLALIPRFKIETGLYPEALPENVGPAETKGGELERLEAEEYLRELEPAIEVDRQLEGSAEDAEEVKIDDRVDVREGAGPHHPGPQPEAVSGPPEAENMTYDLGGEEHVGSDLGQVGREAGVEGTKHERGATGVNASSGLDEFEVAGGLEDIGGSSVLDDRRMVENTLGWENDLEVEPGKSSDDVGREVASAEDAEGVEFDDRVDEREEAVPHHPEPQPELVSGAPEEENVIYEEPTGVNASGGLDESEGASGSGGGGRPSVLDSSGAVGGSEGVDNNVPSALEDAEPEVPSKEINLKAKERRDTEKEERLGPQREAFKGMADNAVGGVVDNGGSLGPEGGAIDEPQSFWDRLLKLCCCR